MYLFILIEEMVGRWRGKSFLCFGFSLKKSTYAHTHTHIHIDTSFITLHDRTEFDTFLNVMEILCNGYITV